MSVLVGKAVKVAVTDLIAFMRTTHGLLLPVQAPDQPVNAELSPTVAVRVTEVPRV